MAAEDYPNPAVFTKIPERVLKKKSGQLSEEQLKSFFEKGYVVIPNYFKDDMDKLDACKTGLADVVETIAQKLFKAGKIKDLHEGADFFHRMIEIDKEWPGAAVLLHKLGIHPQQCLDLWSDDTLLNAVEQIIGSDIAAHPVWNIRPKVPHEEQHTVPWHQDAGYLEASTYTTMQVTAWIPLLDVDANNGCLEMVRGGHKTGKVVDHECCAGNTWYIMTDGPAMEKALDVDMSRDSEVLPVPYGGIVLFSNLIPHRSLDNKSDHVRWSLDLRWQRPDKPYGLYGLKEGTLLRSSTDPELVPDWTQFIGVDRTKKQNEATMGTDEATKDEFDTRIAGPWMKKWPMTHQNRHTSALVM